MRRGGLQVGRALALVLIGACGVFTGRDFGLAWQDHRHGHPEIYFMTFLPP